MTAIAFPTALGKTMSIVANSKVSKACKNPSPGSNALRKGRVSAEGQIYFLTTTSLFRRPIFLDTAVSRLVCKTIHQPWLWRDSRLLAWVLMPNHWHGLVQLGAADSLSTLMGRFKAVTAKAVPEQSRVNGWLWSRGFHDHALRSDEDIRDTVRYLIANPLRAGLVEEVGHYPYWNAAWIGSSSGNSCLT